MIFKTENSAIYIGNLETALDSNILNDYNIQSIVNLAYVDRRGQYDPFNWIKYCNIKVQDKFDSNFIKIIKPAISFIHEQYKQGKNILIHCLEGKSRSVITAITYLILYQSDWIKSLDIDFEQYSNFINPYIVSGIHPDICKVILHVYKLKPNIDPNISILEQINSVV